MTDAAAGLCRLLRAQKAKREPRRQISQEAVVGQALITVPALTQVACEVVNTGNQVIKDHELRFSFPRGVQLDGALPRPAT